jgi:hypothetical protein
MANGVESEGLKDKLRKVLALTTSPNENEAAAATEHLHRLLTKYNLEMADLELRGVKGKPKPVEGGVDLGKAAWKWKLQLADAIADHFYCMSLTDHRTKTVKFVGRPDNVDSLKALYRWLVTQVHDIGTVERRNHFIRTNEHVDPLRWQMNFGLGAVGRIAERLKELRLHLSQTETALVVHHGAEINDYLEEVYGYRNDGKQTKASKRWEEEWDRKQKEKADLLATNPDEYYHRYPYEHPEAVAAREKVYEADRLRDEKRRSRNKNHDHTCRCSSCRATGPRIDEVKEEQAYRARVQGRAAAEKVQLAPFLDGGSGKRKAVQ